MRRYTRWYYVIALAAFYAVGSPALAQNLLEPVEVAVSRAMQQAARVPMRGSVGLGASLQVPGGALARAVAA
ncbi:MAG: hypothetical protein MJ053_05480 [Elusimicrobiaceae bacterium]|nr:hypothetical protein [Elusimicrobiaceae bacterium]